MAAAVSAGRGFLAAVLVAILAVSVGLLLDPSHPASPTVWAPGLAAGGAAFLAVVLAGRSRPTPAAPAAVEAPPGGETLLSFGALPAGGLEERESGLRRLEQELALAQDYGRPLGLVMLGLDASTGSPDLEDTMLGLEEIALGAMRGSDVIFKSGPTELVLLLPETPTEAARSVVRRIQGRSAMLGTVRASLAWADGADSAAAALEELESGLELCRLAGRLTADPFHLLG